MGTKKLLLVVVLVVFALVSTGALASVKISGSMSAPGSNTVVYCGWSSVVFKASNGKTYTGTVSRHPSKANTCAYTISKVPSGVSGTVIAKLSVESKTKAGYYTCWTSSASIKKVSVLGNTINFSSSSWGPHKDSLSPPHYCKK